MQAARVAFLLLLLAAIPLCADEPFGVKRLGPAAVGTGEVMAACGRNDCLALWSELQSGAAEPAIVAMRTSLTGEPLVDRPFLIRTGSLFSLLAVATDGSSYVVAIRENAAALQLQPRMLFVRIDPSNEGVSDASMSTPSGVFTAQLVWSDGVYAALYNAFGGVYAVVADRQGRVLAGEKLISPQVGVMGRVVAAAVDGDRIAMYWTVNGQVSGRAFQPRELLVGVFTPWPPVLLGYGANENLALVSSGSQLLLTWPGFDPVIGPFLAARLVTPEGIPAGPEFRIDDSPSAIVAAGDHYLVLSALVFGTRMTARRLSRSGELLETTTIVDSTPQIALAEAASNGAGVLVLWKERLAVQLPVILRGDAIDFDARRHHGDATARGPLLSPGYAMQTEASIARRGDGNLVAWVETTDVQRVMLARYDAAGRPLDAEPAIVHDTLARQRAPVLATDGDRALLIWYEENAVTRAQTLYGAFIDRNSAHAQTPFVIDTTPGEAAPAAVVCSATQYVVAWQSGATRRIRMARWTRDGLRIDPESIAFFAPNGPGEPPSSGDASPALAWNGRDYYLLFAPEHGDLPPVIITPPAVTLHEIHGIRLSSELLPIGPERLLSLRQTRSGEDATLPEIIADGNGFVATWLQQPLWFQPSLVVARRIDANDGIAPAYGRAFVGNTAPQLARVGNETRLAFGATIVNLDATGAFTNDRTVEAPIVEMASDGNRLLLVQSRFVDRTARLFLVPLAAARGRIVRGS